MIQSAEIVQSILFDKNARQLLQFQRRKVVTASSDVASDPFDERKRLNDIFTEENRQERDAYRGELRKLLGQYQGKKTKSLHIRLLEGIKAKHLVRFEARK